jgi:hypothetical protein
VPADVCFAEKVTWPVNDRERGEGAGHVRERGECGMTGKRKGERGEGRGGEGRGERGERLGDTLFHGFFRPQWPSS